MTTEQLLKNLVEQIEEVSRNKAAMSKMDDLLRMGTWAFSLSNKQLERRKILLATAQGHFEDAIFSLQGIGVERLETAFKDAIREIKALSAQVELSKGDKTTEVV